MRRFYLPLLGLWIILILCGGRARAGVSNAMGDYVYNGRTFLDWSYDFQDNGSDEIYGRLYVPPGYSPNDTTKTYPLVVFYHGNFLTYDNMAHLVNWPTYLLAAAQSRGFFCYLPQAPQNGWNAPGGSYMENSVLQIANIERAYRIDRQRVYLTGFSMGGNAVWSLMGVHGGAFAAAFPVEPNRGGLADSGALDLLGKPVWVFYNRADTASSTIHLEARGRVNQLRTVAGLPNWTFLAMSDTTTRSYFEGNGLRYTEYGNPEDGRTGHSTQWVYQSMTDLYPWMLAQSNTTGWLQPGEKIAFDFGSTQITSGTAFDTPVQAYVQTLRRWDSAGVNWNSTSSGYGINFGAAVAMAKTTAGRSTFVSLSVVDKFIGDYSFTTGSATLFDNGIGKDGWLTVAGGTGNLLLQGLTPGARYKVEIFASYYNSGSTLQTSRYQIGSDSRTLDVYYNTSNKAVFEAVTADAAGQIALSVSGTAASSAYGVIGTLELTALPPPPVISSALTATGTGGFPFSYQIAAANTPASYGATGLPGGVSVNPASGLISGTLAQSGTFSVLLSAANAGGSGTATLTLAVQSPFEAWKNAHFTPGELSDIQVASETACPAGDGIPNLVKYALNLEPKQNGQGGLPAAAPLTTGSGNYLSLTYTRKHSAIDLDYVVEVSGDLRTWSSGDGFTAPVSATDNPDGTTQSVIVRDLIPMGDASRRFIRLKLVKP